MQLPQATTVRDDLGMATVVRFAGHFQYDIDVASDVFQCRTENAVWCRWDCHGLPVEHEIDKKLGEELCPAGSHPH
jgi:hypothetical protein